MGNIDFSNDSMFSWYCVMLAVTGLFTLVLASVTPRLSVWLRALVAVLGIASLSYAYYLVYVFHGGTYVVSFKIFFLPVFLVGGVLRALAMRRDAKLAPKRRSAQEDQWAAERTWYAQRQERAAQAQATQSASQAVAAEVASAD